LTHRPESYLLISSLSAIAIQRKISANAIDMTLANIHDGIEANGEYLV
jgi:hypothetical protein